MVAQELFGNLQVEAINRTDIRDIVASRVKLLRKKIRMVPLKFSRFNQKLALEIQTKWDEENKAFRKQKKSEKPLDRLIRWKDMSRKYRLLSLNELTRKWYSPLWKLRSDAALIAALYEFSEVDLISKKKEQIKSESLRELKSIVLRMKGPRKPTKKKILLRDIKYNVSEAFLEMIKPLEDFAIETKTKVENLIAPRKQSAITTKIKRYLDVLFAREYLTLMCQAVAPRQKAVFEEITKNTQEES
ncbi:MAG: hypothetical protein ACXAD7_02525 [Candidatus Kariarchaeaceae archaeon]|jgi:hypothetical protein